MENMVIKVKGRLNREKARGKEKEVVIRRKKERERQVDLTWGQSYKTFYVCNLRIFDKPFQLSLMFVGKAGAYPRVEQLKKCASLGRLLGPVS
jgi:hypothetical protein